VKEKNKIRALFGLGVAGALIAGLMFYMALVAGVEVSVQNVKKSVQVNKMTRVNVVLNVYEGDSMGPGYEEYICSFERHTLLVIEPVMHMILDFDGYGFEVRAIIQNVNEGLLTVQDKFVISPSDDVEDKVKFLQTKLGSEWKKVDKGL